jgi:hypothetical protein
MYKIWLFVALLFVPGSVFGSMTITEVMYDVSGTDSGREWVEVQNTGSESINFSEWVFYENSSNHGLSSVQGDETILPGGYAVIVDDVDLFLADWSNVTSISIFDSSWSSLSNTGEELSLKDQDDTIVFSFTYDVTLGADGDGNSLQLVDGVWGVGSPTPGLANSVSGSGNTDTSEETTDTNTTSSADGGVAVETQIQSERFVITSDVSRTTVHDSIVFSGELKKPSGSAYHGTIRWNFGDGVEVENTVSQDVQHVYQYPGEYIVTAKYWPYTYTSIEPQHVARTRISVQESPILFTELLSNAVVLQNTTVYESDLSGWYISCGDMIFSIPDGTFIGPNKSRTLVNDVFANFSMACLPRLHFPAGAVASTLELPSQEEVSKPVAPRRATAPAVAEPVTSAPVQTQASVISAFDESSTTTQNSAPKRTVSLPIILFVLLVVAVLWFVVFTRSQEPSDEFEIIE